jgi:uncharacterized membrane protein YgcG
VSPIVRRTLVLIVTALAVALTPALASAAITPTLTASPSSTAAGSSVSLSTDIKFAPSSGDSPKDLTLSLPPGLLSNAAIDGGACLKATAPIAACQVGTGTATATATVIVPVTMQVSLTFYLVAPPKSGDLAGLYIEAGSPVNGPLGSPGEVSIRPADAGVDVAFKNIPNTATIMGLTVKTSVSELQTTLSGVRMPTSCPAAPATINVTADSYSSSSPKSAPPAPLHVTGCSGLPFTPKFAVTAVRDSADTGVQVATDITQAASPPQATSKSVVLTLPTNVFAPNVNAVLTGGILCPSLSSSCKSVGAATSVSPLYPSALVGKAYLIGSLSNLNNIQLVLSFPSPFPLTLTGAVNVAQGTTTFTGLPDLPLTDLKVVLNGGPDSVFSASCNPATGTATAGLTTQYGRTVNAPAPFTVSGCPAGGGGTGGGGTGGGGTGGGGTGGGGTGGGGTGGGGTHTPAPGRPHTSSDTLSGFAHGHPVLRFTAVAGKNAPKLKSLTIVVPSGLGLKHGRRHHPGTTVSVTGAKVKSVAFSHGRIIITLRQAATRLTVTVRGLTVTRKLARSVARRHLKRLAVAIVTKDAKGTRTLLAPVFAVRER